VVVNVLADAPEVGKVFDHWRIDEGQPTLSNANTEKTRVFMPAGQVTITATSKDQAVGTGFAGHNVGGYQGPSTASYVPAQFNGGYSMYVAAWPLMENYPGQKSQSGLTGTWMGTEGDPGYTDIEGGLGWWGDTRFATETPKFIMGGVALEFSDIANGPAGGKEPRASCLATATCRFP
jgi:hypothetical protein